MNRLNAVELWEQGNKQVDKHAKLANQLTILMVILGLGGMVALESLKICGLLALPVMIVPFGFAFRHSLLAARGHRMMREAKVNFGSDEEEYC